MSSPPQTKILRTPLSCPNCGRASPAGERLAPWDNRESRFISPKRTPSPPDETFVKEIEAQGRLVLYSKFQLGAERKESLLSYFPKFPNPSGAFAEISGSIRAWDHVDYSRSIFLFKITFYLAEAQEVIKHFFQ